MFYAGFISKAHCYFAPMVGNTLASPLPSLTLFFPNSLVSWSDEDNWICLLFHVIHSISKDVPTPWLITFIRHLYELLMSFTVVMYNNIFNWGGWQHRWIVQCWRELVSVNLPFERTVHRVDKLQRYAQIPWISFKNTWATYSWNRQLQLLQLQFLLE